MGMSTALALKSSDRDLTVNGITICKINDITPVGTMGDEISFGMTGRTSLHGMGIRVHKRRK